MECNTKLPLYGSKSVAVNIGGYCVAHDKFCGFFFSTFPSNAGGSPKAGSPGLRRWFCFV